MGGFLGDLLFGSKDKVVSKTNYTPEDLNKWMGSIYNSPYAQPYMQQLMQGTMGNMASYGPGMQGGMLPAIAQALASQYGNFLNQGSGLMQGAKSQYIQQGNPGLYPTMWSNTLGGFGQALGASTSKGGSGSGGILASVLSGGLL